MLSIDGCLKQDASLFGDVVKDMKRVADGLDQVEGFVLQLKLTVLEFG